MLDFNGSISALGCLIRVRSVFVSVASHGCHKGLLILFSAVGALGASPALSGLTERTDALGAHLNYGRGCLACHAPTHATYRIGQGDALEAQMLWGNNVSRTYEAVGRPSAPRYKEEVPTGSRGMLVCLTCHSGDYAPAAMIRGTIYEHLRYGHAPPTFADTTKLNAAFELSQHPIGLNVIASCQGVRGWDCIQTSAGIEMKGVSSSKFVANYGFFIKPHMVSNQNVVLCTTCHNPHSMSLVAVGMRSSSEMYPPGVYTTKYFLRAPYGEYTQARRGNLSAQFCRQCHADLSNEMNGSTARSVL